MVAAAVEKIVMAAQAACEDDDTLRQLGAAATAVTEALNSLIEQIRVREDWELGGSVEDREEAEGRRERRDGEKGSDGEKGKAEKGGEKGRWKGEWGWGGEMGE